ncbi:trigger factor [Pseudoglutamicibacter cumminsii]|uniref:trigger factor n=1 Tax=Pseudoglutamicibacter cumminsii TaxID=156979 RepID=UPI001957E674|nr:trigger factor [Pseudoglutamicibacter cumminsii]
MKTSLERVTPTRVKLNIEVPFVDFKPALDASYKEVAQQIQVPGFRRGKVPAVMIDQRVGREYVVENALNSQLDSYYQQALGETGVVPLARPEVEVQQAPSLNDADKEADVSLTITVEARPEIELPDYKGIELTVEPREAKDEDVEKALDELRGRFGTLKSVDRPAKDGDFTTIDISASIDGETVDEATGLSYEIGSGTMLEGIDEALIGLSVDEDAALETKLAGGEHSGEDATVKVTLTAVKERELPEADDEFAQLASEFDTVEELRASLRKGAEKDAVMQQGVEARDKALDALLEKVEVALPESVIEEQVEAHFNSPNQDEDHDTEEHRAEVRENTEKAFRAEIVLDKIADEEEIGVEQNELLEYIFQTSQQYGMDPQQFMQMLGQGGQIEAVVGEVRRRKALAKVLEAAKVKDTDGKDVDLTEFVTPEGEKDAEEASEEN